MSTFSHNAEFFPSWTRKCEPLSSLYCDEAFSINLYATLLAMAVLALIIFINYRRVTRILYGVAPGVLFFMIHSMINTFFWIARLAAKDPIILDIPTAINSNFLDYVEVFDIGIFILQIFLIGALLYKITGNVYENLEFVILFTSVFSSALFYSNTSMLFSLFVPQDYDFEARIMGLLWMPIAIVTLMAVSRIIMIVCDFLDSLISEDETKDERVSERMDGIMIIGHL